MSMNNCQPDYDLDCDYDEAGNNKRVGPQTMLTGPYTTLGPQITGTPQNGSTCYQWEVVRMVIFQAPWSLGLGFAGQRA